MKSEMTPRQANDLRSRTRNAEKRLDSVRAERDYLRNAFVELRDEPETDAGLRKRIQRILNKSFM